MGLDMYLNKRIYVGAKYEHRNVQGTIELTEGKDNKKVNVNPKKVSYIIEESAYWRKANQIHKWFVDNVQSGKDDCGEYYVPNEKLKELFLLCRHVLETKRTNLLPPRSGFFFGSTEIDEWYWKDLEQTVLMLGEIIDSEDFAESDFYYEASW